MNSAECTSEEDKQATRWEKVAVAFALLFLLVLGISSFFPTQRLWGVNHLAYYPLWFRGLVIFLGFLAFIPVVNKGLQSFLKKSVIPAFNFLAEKQKYLGYTIIILFFILFFYLFRTRTHFLGDGASMISYMNSGTFPMRWSEPLAVRVYLSTYDLLNKFSHFDGAVVYALISYLCGAVFVFFALRLAELVGKTTSTKLFVFLAVTFMGGTELFLGYAEHYALLYCGILVYLFCSIKYLEGETKLFLPLLIFFVLLPTHLFALYLFPSAIFLSFSGRGEGETQPFLKTKKIWIVLVVLILVLASLSIYFWRFAWYISGYFVPLSKGRYYAPDYTLFSLPHLLDFLNQQLLVSPIGFFLFLIFLILRPKGLDLKDKIFQFLLLISMAQLCLNFVIDPGLGAARDWDLFASVGLGYTVLSLYLFGKMPPNPKVNYLKLALAVIVFISTLSWMGINTNADISVTRFRNLLDLDPKKSYSGHYVLANYFKDLEKPEEVDRENRMQVEKSPEADLINKGKELFNQGDLSNAYLAFSQALQIAPNFHKAHYVLGHYYLKIGDLEKAEAELRKAIDLAPGYGSAYADLGIMYGLRKDLKKALRMLERAIILAPGDAQAHYNLGNTYFMLQNMDQAIPAYQKAIQMNNEYADPHLGLALVFFQQGKLQESLKEVNKALQINPEFAQAYYHLGMVCDALGKKKESLSALEKYLELEPSGPRAKDVGELIKELESQ